MAKKPHKGGQHPPGYVAKIRKGRRQVAAYIELDLFNAMHEMTLREGTTIQATVERLCRAFVDANRKLPRPKS